MLFPSLSHRRTPFLRVPAQMSDDEITRWIRWQRCKVILAVAAEFLFITFIPLAIIIWLVVRFAQL